jgi:hypothetical protein
MHNNKFKIVLTDRRGCTFNAAYYKTFELAQKRFESVVYDKYWKNNTIQIVDAVIEPIGRF